LICVAPEALRMPVEVVERLRARGFSVEETDSLEDALGRADALYMTRIQKERFADPAEYEQLKDAYVLDRAMIERLRPDVTVLHPLPRINEIATDVDALPNAAYFRQAQNGVFVRMALLAMVLGAA
jgi:aspartate carbamoyltransferase catalytic subunit